MNEGGIGQMILGTNGLATENLNQKTQQVNFKRIKLGTGSSAHYRNTSTVSSLPGNGI